MLLVQRHYVSKDRIREFLYPDASTEAFEKMFERDKEELRSLGVPIEVGSMDAYFDDEPGYRVRPDQFALPDIALTPDEAAVIGLATRVWQHARLADATTRGGPQAHRRSASRSTSRRSTSPSPGCRPTSRRSTSSGRPPRSGRRSSSTTAAPGHRAPPPGTSQPWGVVRYSGRWYVVGLRHRPRRGAGLPALPGRGRGAAYRQRPASYDVPPGTDVRATAVRLAPPPSTGEAVVLVRRDAGIALRADAVSVEADVTGPDTRTAWDRVRISRGGTGVADELLGYGAGVYVESPDELRTEVVDRLRAVVDRESPR